MVAFAQSIVEDLNRIVCEDREKQVHRLYNYAGCMESGVDASDTVPVVPPPGVVLADITPG